MILRRLKKYDRPPRHSQIHRAMKAPAATFLAALAGLSSAWAQADRHDFFYAGEAKTQEGWQDCLGVS